ncbi:TetR/AcrR family transcriptional regulator [Kitasatospora sp. NPDC005748]|uniref:TetR/AcrR family transcriptional regulator n=1 Tax=Kitasatospora sp. NPDC005748 TaxID=3157063 RepID=UPI0033CB3CE3
MATRAEDPQPDAPAARTSANGTGTGSGTGAGPGGGTGAGARRPRASAKGEQTRARLLAAARELLAGDGSVPFTTRNVAALGGVTHGMCHYHFQNRTDLIVAVVESIRPEWITPLEEAVAGPGTFTERAERVVTMLAQPEAGDLSRLHSALHWFAVGDERVREALEAEYRRWRACFVALFQVLADERGDGFDPRPLGEAAAAGTDGLAAIQSLGAEVDPAPVMRALVLGLAAGAGAR